MDDTDRYYEILGLKPGASLERVKEAFRDLVKVWHPDRFSRENPRLQKKAEEKLKEINLAYQRLESFLSSQESQQADRVHQTRQAHQAQPPPKAKATQANRSQQRPKPQPPPKPTPRPTTEQRKQEIAYRVNSALLQFESGLRAVLQIVAIKLPPLTVQGRIKALLLLLGAIYFLAAAIYLLVSL
jgi:curved DNA-binding protein CbpA